MSDLSIRDLRVRVGVGAGAFDAVDGVDLEVPAGAIVGLVGESGSGKSTLARAVVGLAPIAGGKVLLDDSDYAAATGRRRRQLRQRVQLVFQDPRASLNPRMTVGDAVREAIGDRRMSRRERTVEVERLFELVALDPALAMALPRGLSGGQRQRVALARALAVRPEVIVADEITASLDVSVQGAVLNLLRELRRETGLSLVVISHNLAIVRYLSDSIAVMQLGRIVEHGDVHELLEQPQHPYTQTLIDSVSLDDRAAANGPVVEAPDPLHPPTGCRFHLACPVGPLADPERSICTASDPGAEASSRVHRAACHFAPRVAAQTEVSGGR